MKNYTVIDIAVTLLIVGLAAYAGSFVYKNMQEGISPAPAQAPIAIQQMSAVPGSMNTELLKDVTKVRLRLYKQAVIQTAAKCVELNVSDKSAHSDSIKTGCARASWEMDHFDK